MRQQPIRAFVVFAAAGTLAACAAASAPPVVPLDRSSFQNEIGKRKWTIAELCTDPSILHCPTTINGYFTINDVTVADGQIFYVVTLDDGRQGFIPFTFRDGFTDDPPEVAMQKHLADCKRRGVPRIGMSAKQVEATCWGAPDHVNRTETSSAIDDQYVYGDDRYVYLRNGVVTSIQVTDTR